MIPGQDEEGRQRVAGLARDAKLAMLTTMTSQGRHRRRPMALASHARTRALLGWLPERDGLVATIDRGAYAPAAG